MVRWAAERDFVKQKADLIFFLIPTIFGVRPAVQVCEFDFGRKLRFSEIRRP